jgi:hypothetical protein
LIAATHHSNQTRDNLVNTVVCSLRCARARTQTQAIAAISNVQGIAHYTHRVRHA